MNETDELRYLILAAQREGNRVLAQALRPLDLTPSQAEVISILGERPTLTLNRLGELLVCDSGSSPSRLVDRLVSKGLVDRRASTADRRSIELTLTATGAHLAKEVVEIDARLRALMQTALDRSDSGRLAEFLWTIVRGTPAGDALARRKSSADALARDGSGLARATSDDGAAVPPRRAS